MFKPGSSAWSWKLLFDRFKSAWKCSYGYLEITCLSKNRIVSWHKPRRHWKTTFAAYMNNLYIWWRFHFTAQSGRSIVSFLHDDLTNGSQYKMLLIFKNRRFISSEPPEFESPQMSCRSLVVLKIDLRSFLYKYIYMKSSQSLLRNHHEDLKKTLMDCEVRLGFSTKRFGKTLCARQMDLYFFQK